MGTIYVSPVPAMIFAVFVGGILLLLVLGTRRGPAWLIGTMLFLASISVILDYDKSVYPTMLLPIQAYRSELFGFLGVVLLLGMLPRFRELSLRPISGQAWVLLAMGLYASLLRMYHVSPMDGFISAGFALATIVPLALVLPVLLRSDGDGERLLAVAVWTAVAWVGFAALQFVVAPRLVVVGLNHRFTGLIANCNQAATLLSVVIACTVWLALHGRRRMRTVYIVLAGLFLLLLVWTASRGGMLMCLLGVSAVLYSRAGRSVLFLPLLAVVFFVVLQLAEAAGVSLDADRLLSTTNTRTEGLAKMFSHAVEHPWIGVGTEGAEASENSYLMGMAAYGIGMLLLMLVLTGVGARQVFQMVRLRRRVSPDRVPLLDFCIGQQCVYFFGAMLEGYMHSRVGSQLVFMLLFAQIGSGIVASEHAPGWQAEPAGVVDGEDSHLHAELLPEG